MKVFNKEKLDNLEDKILSNNKIVLASAFKRVELSKDDFSALAAKEQSEDLYTLDFILVSTGWNKNDDYFDKAETFRAKSTPVNKQLNFMHDDAKIIGHILETKVLPHGYPRSNPSQEIDENNLTDFDIAVSAFVYKYFRDEEKKEIVNEIFANLSNWYVSMECLFDDFDYIVGTEENSQIVARSEDTSWMSKHLRAFGGSGEYDGKKVGRVLRNIIFSGIGIVDNPANPRSIIFTKDTPFVSEVIESNNMELEKELATVKTALASVTQENEDLKALAEEAKTALEAAKNALATQEAKLKTLEQEIAQAQLEKVKIERKSKLLACNVDEAKANELVEKFANSSAELFEEVVHLASLAAPKKEVAKEEKEDEEKEDESIAEVGEVEESTAASDVEKKDDNKVIEEALAKFVSYATKRKGK
jgi:hypothetical protein